MPPKEGRRILITGPAGSGKTHAVLQQVLTHLREGRGDSTICLLPTYGQVEHTKRRFVSLAEAEAIFDPPFLTFTGLYERLIPGRRIRHLASSMERRRLMEAAIDEADVEAFRKVADTPGFRERALQVVKEIRECGLSSDEVREEVESEFGGDDPASKRIRGFLEVAMAYEAGMRRAGVTDHEGALMETLEALSAGRGQDPTFVAVDGFANFTRLETAILEALSQRTPEMLVTLPRDRDRALGLFRISQDTWSFLTGLGFREEVLLENRRAGCEAHRQISLHLFAEGPSPVPGSGRVRHIVGADRPSEVDLIAREIGRIRRGEAGASGASTPHLREIGIVLRRLDAYRDLIPSIFARHGIPVRLVLDPLPLKSEPILRHALGFLSAVAGRFESDGFLRYLLSGHVASGPRTLTPADRKWIRAGADRLADEVRQKGPPQDLDALLKLGSGMPRSFQRLAAYLVRLRDSLQSGLRSRAMAALMEDALAGGICTAFEGQRGDVSGEPSFWQDRFRKESAALAALRDAIREAGSPRLWGGDEASVSAGDFIEAVTDSVLDATAPIRDRRLNCVNVIDAREARHWDSLRVVFVAGLLEKEFPTYPREDIFIRDRERERLNRNTRLSLRENLRQRDEERYLFYVAATRPRDLLYLCHPSHDAAGKEVQPSFYVGDLLGLFDDDKAQKRQASLARPCPPPEEAALRDDLEMEVARTIGLGPDLSPLALPLYHTAPDRNVFRRGIDFLRVGGEPLTDEDLREAIAERMTAVSASSVNLFLQCPHRHFVSKLLGVEEPERGIDDRLDPMEVGGIAHEVLELHHKEKGKRPVEDLLEEVMKRDLDPLDLGVSRKLAEARLRRLLLWTLERERGDHGPFRSAKVEQWFGKKEGVTLEHDSGPILLRGRIDRIDTGYVGGREYCLPVDYKLTYGFGKGERDDLEEIEDVQLLLYAEAARRLLGLPVGGVELFPLGTRTRGGVYLEALEEAVSGRVEAKKHTLFVSEEEMDDLIEKCLEKVRDVVGSARGGEVARDPLDPAGCTAGGCDAFLICRPDRAALFRQAREEGE